MILDASTLDQTAAVDRIVRGVEGCELPGRVKTELHASIFELNTEPVATAHEVLEALTALRRAAAEAAGAEGLAIAAGGTHPFAKPEAQPIVKEDRYVEFVSYAGISARRQGVQGLHVHIAVPDAEACWRLLEAMLPWLPVVLALSANSPWLAGELTGMASNRAPVLAELPRAGAPPSFESYAAWEAWVERLARLGILQDATRIWWDARPAPHLGTLEIRVADQPTDVRRSAAFAALLQALCRQVVTRQAPAPRGARIEATTCRTAGRRPGSAGRPCSSTRDGDRAATAAELAAELLELVAPSARRLGSADLLAVLDPALCEADLQSRHEGAHEAAADLAARSIA